MSDHLWDKGGDVDPEVDRLERTLGVFAQSMPPPPLDLRRPAEVRNRYGRSALLIAASLALVVGGLVLALILRRSTPAWQVTTAGGRSSLPIGAWLDTSAGQATMAVADIGTVTVEPGARVRLLDSRTGHHRMELARGTMHATIWAPPNQFFVETPSTLAVDLGCAYTLTVDEDGGGLVTVLVGWVGFSTGDRESFIPAGFAAVTRPRIGPGTPYSERTTLAYQQALALLDFSPGADSSQALTLVLDQSEERDEVTLWHLLSRVPAPDRDRVFDRLASFVPPPTGVTRDGIRADDRRMLDAWWDALGLGTTSLWRTWSQEWKDNYRR
ncbi:MAG TPA: hypothetical protein VGQ37_14620 [Vicinamibacterales bacterium]|jgi:hypothetical protein|nr:hypothetical protein [Vicinamibacterales bacterium]